MSPSPGTVKLRQSKSNTAQHALQTRLQSGARNLLPRIERAGAKHSVVDGAQQMAPDAKPVADNAVDREKALRLGRRFEPPHVALPLARGLVGDFGSVVLVVVGTVRNVRHHGAVGSGIAAQLVRHDSSGLPALPAQQLLEEAFGGPLVAPRLEKDIDHVAVLIDGPPEILSAPLNGDEQFIQVPRVTQPPLPSLEASSVLRPEPETPQADGLVGDRDAPLGEEIFDVAEAQTESVVEPHGVTDDFRGNRYPWYRGVFVFIAAVWR